MTTQKQMNQHTAFVFPGQGSQKVGMLNDLAEDFPVVKKLYQQASDLLAYDLWEIVEKGPAEKLNQTVYTQPALLVADIAVWQIYLTQCEQLPAVLAGHSLGEYAALVAAEALSFEEAVMVVAKRGQFMQEAVPAGQGAMAAIIKLPLEKINEVCQQAAQGEVVSVANLNEAQQTVIAGQSAAVDRAVELAKQAGAKLAMRLPVSVPSHCALMKPAAERLLAVLKSIKVNAPKIPVINNVDVKAPTSDEEIRDALVRQVYSSVHWYQTIESMVQQGVTKVVECGPGAVLSGLNRRINRDLQVVSLGGREGLENFIKEGA